MNCTICLEELIEDKGLIVKRGIQQFQFCFECVNMLEFVIKNRPKMVDLKKENGGKTK